MPENIKELNEEIINLLDTFNKATDKDKAKFIYSTILIKIDKLKAEQDKRIEKGDNI